MARLSTHTFCRLDADLRVDTAYVRACNDDGDVLYDVVSSAGERFENRVTDVATFDRRWTAIEAAK